MMHQAAMTNQQIPSKIASRAIKQTPNTRRQVAIFHDEMKLMLLTVAQTGYNVTSQESHMHGKASLKNSDGHQQNRHNVSRAGRSTCLKVTQDGAPDMYGDTHTQ